MTPNDITESNARGGHAPDADARTDTGAGACLFRASRPYAVLLALVAVLGSLTLASLPAGIEAFYGISLFVLSVFIVFGARAPVPMYALLLPSYVWVLFTGSFTVPALLLGLTISSSAVCMLLRGQRLIVLLSAAALALAVPAVFAGDRTAYTVALAALPFAVGAVAAVCYIRLPMAHTVVAVVVVLLAGAAAVAALYMIPNGIPLPGADSLRDALSSRLQAITTSEGPLMNDKTAASLAAGLINISPSLVCAASTLSSLLIYRLIEAMYASAGLYEALPLSARELELSPASGAVCAVCAVCMTVADAAGFAFALTVSENLLYLLALPFSLIGVRTAHRFLCRRFADRRIIPLIILAAVAVVAPLVFFASAAWLGTMRSLAPVWRAINDKFKPNNEGDT